MFFGCLHELDATIAIGLILGSEGCWHGEEIKDQKNLVCRLIPQNRYNDPENIKGVCNCRRFLLPPRQKVIDNKEFTRNLLK